MQHSATTLFAVHLQLRSSHPYHLVEATTRLEAGKGIRDFVRLSGKFLIDLVGVHVDALTDNRLNIITTNLLNVLGKGPLADTPLFDRTMDHVGIGGATGVTFHISIVAPIGLTRLDAEITSLGCAGQVDADVMRAGVTVNVYT